MPTKEVRGKTVVICLQYQLQRFRLFHLLFNISSFISRRIHIIPTITKLPKLKKAISLLFPIF